MKYTKIYADTKGETHFVDRSIDEEIIEAISIVRPGRLPNFSKIASQRILLFEDKQSET